MNACGDSRLRGLRSRKPIDFRQWVVHDSKTAIEYIDVIRKITCDIQKSVVDCSKLGFFHIFANIKDEKQLRIYIPDAVNEIHQYDIKKN